jgi:hypothetical protein
MGGWVLDLFSILFLFIFGWEGRGEGERGTGVVDRLLD